MEPKFVLDFGCGGGGVSYGYHLAGLPVVGIDLVRQPRYPFRFIQADMLEVAGRLASAGRWRDIDLADILFIHWSAPCQRWSKQVRCRPELRERYPDLITPMRPLVRETGLPFIAENVEGAPLVNPVTLCAASFGREMYRHRLFEAGGGLTLTAPRHPPHAVRASRAGHWEPGTFFSVAGHVAPMQKAREVMGIDWLPREDLVEAVPPYMAQYVGYQAAMQLLARAA